MNNCVTAVLEKKIVFLVFLLFSFFFLDAFVQAIKYSSVPLNSLNDTSLRASFSNCFSMVESVFWNRKT
jgi:hypothetical protein